MADIQHKDITDPFLHEPKGVVGATLGAVYIANGSGSGSWSVLTTGSLDTADLESFIQGALDDDTIVVKQLVEVTVVLPDISTDSSVLVPIPGSRKFTGARATLADAITAADANITFLNSAGTPFGTAVTIPFAGSAKGTSFSFTPTAGADIAGPSWLEVKTDGASTGTVPLSITLQFEV